VDVASISSVWGNRLLPARELALTGQRGIDRKVCGTVHCVSALVQRFGHHYTRKVVVLLSFE
jgi:hypothetical protein